MNIDVIRDKLRTEIVRDDISLRTLEARTGISFSTLSRFLRGAVLEHKNVETLHCYVTGQKLPVKKELSSKRIVVGGKKFLVTIEEIK